MENNTELSPPFVDEEPSIQVEPDLTSDETCELIPLNSIRVDVESETSRFDELKCHRRSDSQHREWLQIHFDAV